MCSLFPVAHMTWVRKHWPPADGVLPVLALQGEELEPARKKAEAAGVRDIFIDDLREEFTRDYVFPMFRCARARCPLTPFIIAFSGWFLGWDLPAPVLDPFFWQILQASRGPWWSPLI